MSFATPKKRCSRGLRRSADTSTTFRPAWARATPRFADDVVWDFSGFPGWVEDTEYHGKDGFDAQMERWTEAFDEWSMEVTDVVDAGGDDVLVVGIQRGVMKGSGATVEMPLANLVTVEDGKLKRLRMFMTAEDAYAAAGIQPPA